MELTPNIVAVASPPGVATRGIVRLSGDGVFAWLAPHVAEPVTAWTTRGLFAVTLVDLFRSPLRSLALVTPGPGSYTGQDAVEFYLPGNPVILERLVTGLCTRGVARGLDCRLAHAGEFTARAYLNGRMSLPAAEAVAAIVEARSDAELAAARLLGEGKLARLAGLLRERLATLLALVEAGIDFTDQEDVVPIAPAQLAEELESIGVDLDRHLERAVGMETLAALPWVVLDGPPNAGKSSLFNALLRADRALTTSIAGTTRDVLAEPLVLHTDHGPAEIMLVDVAGFDEGAATSLEQAMQLAAAHARGRSELRIVCVPPGAPPPPPADDAVLVFTKADEPGFAGGPGLAVSVRSGDGVETLRDALATRLADRTVSLAADTLALMPRHEAALRGVRSAVADAAALVDRAGRTLGQPELVAAALRTALDETGAIAGIVTPDDVLGRIFATFCIGK